MSDRHYFINCRGSDFFPSYETVWEKSGNIPTTARTLYQGITSSMKSDTLIYNGATRISTWVHFDEQEISKQIKLLKSAGINLLRVHLDLYCWAALGSTMIDRAKKLARLAQDNKIYIQWVLFEADTPNDIPGYDISGRYHEVGGLDPYNLNDAMAYGLHHYQRCPTVYNSNFLSRHPSSMVVSGNQYFQDMIGSLSSYRSTLSWEVMANVDFDSVLNPADVSAYSFLASAIDKANLLVPPHQKVTTSFKKVKLDNQAQVADSSYPVDLYFLLGDSLADGTGAPSELDALGYGIEGEYKGAITNVYTFHPSASRWASGHPELTGTISIIGDNLSVSTSPRFEQSITEQNTSPGYGIFGIPFGYELMFMPMMRTHFNRPAYMVKLARGGSLPASGPVNYAGAATPHIYPSSVNDWDTYNDELYYKFLGFLSSGIDVLNNVFGKNRVICRGGIISLGTNNPQVAIETNVSSVINRIDSNYRRLTNGIRELLSIKKAGSNNTKIIAMLPDIRLKNNDGMVPGYIEGVRGVLSALGNEDKNIITYDPPSSIVNFIGTSRGGSPPGDVVHYDSSSEIYLGSSIANILKSYSPDNNVPYKVSSIYNKLDYICYKGYNGGFIDRTVNYIDALSAAASLSKPLMVIDATVASKLNHLHTEVSAFSALQVGFITDGIIDRNYSNKPNNNSRGIFFTDGSVRDSRYTESLKKKFIQDIKNINPNKLIGNKFINNNIQTNFLEKTNYEVDTLWNSTYIASSLSRLSQAGTEGEDLWNYMKKILYYLPELNSLDFLGINNVKVGTKYAPYGNTPYSKSLGYDISNKDYYIDKNDISKGSQSSFLLSIDPYFNINHNLFLNYYSLDSVLINSVIGIVNANGKDLFRDRLCSFKIKLLEQLQRALPVSAFNDNIVSSTYPNIINSNTLSNLLKAYAPFSAPSVNKFSISSTVITSSINPVVGNPKLLSGTYDYVYLSPTSLPSLYMKPFIPDLSSCQKPACYFLRGPGYLSGACYYKSDVSVDPNINSNQNVLSKLDWEKYDTAFYNWYVAIRLCWEEVTLNYPSYLTTLNGIISSAFSNSDSTNNPNPTLPNLSGVI